MQNMHKVFNFIKSTSPSQYAANCPWPRTARRKRSTNYIHNLLRFQWDAWPQNIFSFLQKATHNCTHSQILHLHQKKLNASLYLTHASSRVSFEKKHIVPYNISQDCHLQLPFSICYLWWQDNQPTWIHWTTTRRKPASLQEKLEEIKANEN